MRREVNYFNNLFIKGLLVLFYWTIIGFSSVILRIFSGFSNKKYISYWKNPEKKNLETVYFESEY